MTLPLTPDTLKAAYDFLCTTPPFSKWNMPDSEDVVFEVGKDPSMRGWHYSDDGHGRHKIVISKRTIGQAIWLLMTMAHEMIHVHQHETKSHTKGAEHNGAFHKWAAQVCKVHAFDPKMF